MVSIIVLVMLIFCRQSHVYQKFPRFNVSPAIMSDFGSGVLRPCYVRCFRLKPDRPEEIYLLDDYSYMS